ncbi:hypothetical protein [Amycolatopsis alba]|uniref:hypothetical protein n=1 Tax=Amycolatopsis alba TaxID=76020 RepID=UPI0003A6E3B5|nr:hypothetical protein [Amycolatopsis alba]
MDTIDEQTLVAVADLICGDGTMFYRKGNELAEFFRRAGWKEITAYDGDTRKSWTVTHLLRRQDEPNAIERILTRLADPRDYPHDRESANEVRDRLNLLLEVENLHVELDDDLRPVIKAGRAAPKSIPEDISRQKLQYSIEEIVTDQALVPLLNQRIIEIEKCRANGCYLAAMIHLGGLVEGLLMDAAVSRPIPDSIWDEPEAKAERVRRAPADKLTLHSLIYAAHRLRWIDTDVYRIVGGLRSIRNLVHPHAQRKSPGDVPDEDTVDMYWPVFIGTVNDLGRTRPGESSARQARPAVDSAGPWARRKR